MSDDDDGVTFSALEPGSPASVTVTGGPAAPVGYLHLWIDYNRDGDWDDAGEYVLAGERIANGTVTLPFTVPTAAGTGPTFARARLAFESTLGPGGVSTGGEVEDYMVMLGPGDTALPAIASPTSLGNGDYYEMLGQDLTNGAAFEVVANRTGIFSVEAGFDYLGGDLGITVFNSNGIRVASNDVQEDDERIDFTAIKDEKYLISFDGSNPLVDIRIANQVTNWTANPRLSANANLTFPVTGPIEVTVNDLAYQFDSFGSSVITLYGSDGQDAADIGNRWFAEGVQTAGGETYDVYAKGLTTIMVSNDIATTVGLLGDVAPDGSIDSVDIDSLYDAIEAGSTDPIYDLDFSGNVGKEDVDVLVRDVLDTSYGDTDLDGDVDIFDITTLVANFAPVSSDSSWSQGDFDGDGDTDITDVIRLVVNYAPFGVGAANAPSGGTNDLLGSDAHSSISAPVRRTEEVAVSVSGPTTVAHTVSLGPPTVQKRLERANQPVQSQPAIVAPPTLVLIEDPREFQGNGELVWDDDEANGLADELMRKDGQRESETATVDRIFAEAAYLA